MRRVNMKRVGLTVALLLVTGPAMAGKVELKVPKHGYTEVDLQTQRAVEDAKDRLKWVREQVAKGAFPKQFLTNAQGKVTDLQGQANQVKQILRHYNIDDSSIQRDFTFLGMLLHVPGRITVVQALMDVPKARYYFYAPDGILLRTADFPEGHTDVKLAHGGGDGLAGRQGMFWFSVDNKRRYIGIVISYRLGDMPASRPGVAYMFARPFVLTPKRGVTESPLVLYGTQYVYGGDSADRLNPSTGCIFIGDVNGDGFQDLVLWKKRYRIPPSLDPEIRWQAWHTGKPWNPKGCIKVEQSVVVMLFSPTKERFLDPKPAPELLPMDKKLWYDNELYKLWPTEDSGISEFFDCSYLCQGCKD